jgi:hypothetical protein
MKYGKYWFHLQKNKKIIHHFHVFEPFIAKICLERKMNFRLSRGVVIWALQENCINASSAVSSARKLKFRLPKSFENLVHFILKI